MPNSAWLAGDPRLLPFSTLTAVYGLSIATELTNRGLKVAVVARDLPEDDFSTGFASPWAVSTRPRDRGG